MHPTEYDISYPVVDAHAKGEFIKVKVISQPNQTENLSIEVQSPRILRKELLATLEASRKTELEDQRAQRVRLIFLPATKKFEKPEHPEHMGNSYKLAVAITDRIVRGWVFRNKTLKGKTIYATGDLEYSEEQNRVTIKQVRLVKEKLALLLNELRSTKADNQKKFFLYPAENHQQLSKDSQALELTKTLESQYGVETMPITDLDELLIYHYVPAPVWERVAAALLDLAGIVLLILFILSINPVISLQTGMGKSVLLLVSLLFYSIYYASMQSSSYAATLGMQLFNLRAYTTSVDHTQSENMGTNTKKHQQLKKTSQQLLKEFQILFRNILSEPPEETKRYVLASYLQHTYRLFYNSLFFLAIAGLIISSFLTQTLSMATSIMFSLATLASYFIYPLRRPSSKHFLADVLSGVNVLKYNR